MRYDFHLISYNTELCMCMRLTRFPLYNMYIYALASKKKRKQLHKFQKKTKKCIMLVSVFMLMIKYVIYTSLFYNIKLDGNNIISI